MMAALDYDTVAIVQKYIDTTPSVGYREETDLPPVEKNVETKYGLRPGPLFNQHPLVIFFICLTSNDDDIEIHILVLSVVLLLPLASLMADKCVLSVITSVLLLTNAC